ncbi:MAG: FadR/GntR family transcriptional regulator, partial [Chloroflexota bacterium]
EHGKLRAEMQCGEAAIDDAADMVAHDTRLHRLIHECARNPLALSTSASLAQLAHRARLWTVTFPANGRLTVREHAVIVEAITARKAQAAEVAMRRHLSRIERQLRGAVTEARERSPSPLAGQ